jgi:hypothetical protein
MKRKSPDMSKEKKVYSWSKEDISLVKKGIDMGFSQKKIKDSYFSDNSEVDPSKIGSVMQRIKNGK